MAAGKGVSICSVVLGFMILVMALGSIAGGAVAIHKFNNLGAASIGLWAVYFVIQGAICLVAGFGKYRGWFGASICVHVFGIFISLGCLSWAGVYWTVFGDCTTGTGTNDNYCWCTYRSTRYLLKISCDDLDDVRLTTAVVTLIYLVLMILSFVGSIIGCAVACCGREEYRGGMYPSGYVVPVGNPNSMMMTRIEERRYIESDPYPHQGRYIQPPPQYREPYNDYYRGDQKQNRGYIEDRRSGNNERYPDEKPSYQPNRGLPAPPRHEPFAGGRNDDRFGYYN